MRIDVLIENTSHDSLLCEHGLSFLIHYHDKMYLLDAGQSGNFIENAKSLNIDLNQVKQCILSHGHYDHSDGYVRFLDVYPHHKVYAYKDIFEDYYSSSNDSMHYIGLCDELKKRKDHFHLIDKLTCIDEGVYVLPHQATCNTVNKNLYKKVNNAYIKDDFRHELSLIFVYKDELVVLNSCSHVGMMSIVEDIKKYFPSHSIKAYFGGLHMKGKENNQEICVYSDEQIIQMSELIKKEKMNVYTGHCTGLIGYAKLSQFVSENIHKLYSGMHVFF